MTSFSQAAGAWFDGKVDALNRKSFKALREAMEAGENVTKHNIENRGTDKSGKRGRIDTGKMRDSVESEAKLVSKDEAIGKFGWIDKKPFYVEFQEPGTERIPAMWALSDAAEEILQDYLHEMDGIVKDA